jgi:hypothetical protein
MSSEGGHPEGRLEAEPEGFGPRLRELRDVLHDDLADAGLET